MFDAEKQVILEQGIATLKELYCTGCSEFYNGFKETGFSEDQAFRLTRDWLIAVVTRPIDDLPSEQ